MQMHARIESTALETKQNQAVSILIVINGKLSTKSFKVDTLDQKWKVDSLQYDL